MAQLWRCKAVLTAPSGSPYFNQTYWVKSPGLDVRDSVSKYRTFWNDIKSYIQEDTIVQVSNEIDVVDIDTGNIIDVTTIDPVDAVLGTDSGQALPWATQGLARFVTGVYVSGRALRGRLFIPAITESNNVAGIPGSGMLSAVNGAITSMTSAGLDASMAVYSRTHHVAAPTVGGNMWNQWSILRSRRD